jgi:hypothetical protein
LGLELGPWKGRYCGLDIQWLRWFETNGVIVPTAAELAARRAEELAARVAEYERRFGKLE